MKKLLILFLAFLTLAAFANDAVTDETVQKLLRDMGDVEESFQMPETLGQSLVLVSGKKEKALGVIAGAGDDAYLYLSPRALSDNGRVTFYNSKGEKLQPGGIEISGDGRILRVALKEKPAFKSEIGLPKPPAFLRTFLLIESNTFSYVQIEAKSLAEGRVKISKRYTVMGSPSFTEDHKFVGVLENRLAKNLPDWSDPTNRYFLAAENFIARADDAKWEKVKKSFLLESAACDKMQNELDWATDIVRFWVAALVSAPLESTHLSGINEDLLAWIKEHNERAVKGKSLIEGKQNKSKDGKQFFELAKKDGSALKQTIKKSLEKIAPPANFEQPALSERWRQLKEQERELIKNIDAALNHVESSFK